MGAEERPPLVIHLDAPLPRRGRARRWVVAAGVVIAAALAAGAGVAWSAVG